MLDDGFLTPTWGYKWKKTQKQSHSICAYKKISLVCTFGIYLQNRALFMTDCIHNVATMLKTK